MTATSASVAAAATRSDTETDPKAELAAKYRTDPPQVRELVARVAERFGRNAQAIERTDGLRGLVLLDRLDLEAIFLYEKHPTEFRRLRDFLGGDAAADLLLHWREYFGLKRADDTDRGILIAEIASLTPAQQRIAARHPSVLPLILADPAGVTELDRADGGRREDTGRRAGGALLHQPGARVFGPPVRACERSTITDRSPSRPSAGMGWRDSPWSVCTGRSWRHWATPCPSTRA